MFTLQQLSEALQRAVNEDLTTIEGVERALKSPSKRRDATPAPMPFPLPETGDIERAVAQGIADAENGEVKRGHWSSNPLAQQAYETAYDAQKAQKDADENGESGGDSDGDGERGFARRTLDVDQRAARCGIRC